MPTKKKLISLVLIIGLFFSIFSPAPAIGANFEIMGKVMTGDLNQPSQYWQSGDYCPGYPIQDTPSPININDYHIGKLGLSTNLCDPEPYYLYDYYAAGNNEAPDGPITLTLHNLPEGYECVGWTWSGDTPNKEGTGCSLNEDFQDYPPFSGTGIRNGRHIVSFYIKEGQLTPTPILPSGTTPLPVMGEINFMMVKLGKVSPDQQTSFFMEVLISFFDWIRWLQKHQ